MLIENNLRKVLSHTTEYPLLSVGWWVGGESMKSQKCRHFRDRNSMLKGTHGTIIFLDNWVLQPWRVVLDAVNALIFWNLVMLFFGWFYHTWYDVSRMIGDLKMFMLCPVLQFWFWSGQTFLLHFVLQPFIYLVHPVFTLYIDNWNLLHIPVWNHYNEVIPHIITGEFLNY